MDCGNYDGIDSILIVTYAVSTDHIGSKILRDRSGLSLESPVTDITVQDSLHIVHILASDGRGVK